MKVCPNRGVARVIGTLLVPLLLLTVAYGLTRAQVTPTSEWVNFFSANTTFLGVPVPPGTAIAAFDHPLDAATPPAKCGEFTVLVAGAYGVMPCYRDDPTTTPDEGAEPGDPISFTINGFPATPIAVSLNGTPVPAGTPVTWTSFGDLWEVDLQVVASPTPSSTATPTPTATGTSIPSSSTSTATATPSPTVTPTSGQQADLSVAKAVDNLTPRVGDVVTFTITVANVGPTDATNVAVLDLLPAGVDFVSATPGQGSCIETNGTVVCSLDTLVSGAQAAITITVVPTVGGQMTNTATVSANQADPNPGDNVARVSFTVSGVGRPVGGYGEPATALGLLMPWVVLVVVMATGAILGVARMRS